MSGKVAVVSGGTRGIGKSISESLANNGFHLVLNYHKDEEAAENFKKELKEKHPNLEVRLVKGDMAMSETINQLDSECSSLCNGKVDAIVFNHGFALPVHVLQLEEQHMDLMINTYAKSFLNTMKKLTPRLNDQLGRVVYITSPGIDPPSPIYAAAGAGKCLGEHLCLQYSLALAERGISVNIVKPGFIKTEGWKGYFEAMPKLEALPPTVTPMKRWGFPEDIGPTVAFLCSKEAGFITAQTITIDGGCHAARFRTEGILSSLI